MAASRARCRRGWDVGSDAAGGRPPTPAFAPGLALYTVAVRSDRRRTVVAWAATALTLVVAAAFAPGDDAVGSTLESILSLLAMTGLFAAVGNSVRNRRAYVAAVEERAARAERSREEEALRRVAEERLRIARELHDVVAHHIAVISVQAGLAGHLVFKQPQAAHDALEHAQQASATILDELGGILTVLREDDEFAEGDAPAPGLRQLDALVASYAAAGLQVKWSSTGPPRHLAATVDLVAYRVLQEALTNAHRHGTGVAHVSVQYFPSSVALEVTNPMRGGGLVHDPGRGYGLIGMKERATAVGGVLDVGPSSQSQFRVKVTLPVQPGPSE